MTRGSRRSASAVSMGAWTLFVWVGRVRNIIGDDSLAGTARVVALGTAVCFVVIGVGFLALGAGFGARRSRFLGGDGDAIDASVKHGRIESVVAAGVGLYWAVRATAIALRDHSVGFVVVHTVLAIVSIGLAAWVVLDRRRDRGVGDGSGRPTGRTVENAAMMP